MSGLANNFIDKAKQTILFKQLSKFEGKKNRLPHKCQMILPTAGASWHSAFYESYYEVLITLCYFLVTPKKGNSIKIILKF